MKSCSNKQERNLYKEKNTKDKTLKLKQKKLNCKILPRINTYNIRKYYYKRTKEI